MKKEIDPKTLIYPLPTILLGAEVNNKPTYNVVGNCGIISVNPPVVYISSHKNHYTNIGIRENQAFSINIPSTDMVAITDHCGMVSGRDIDKSKLFKSFYGKNKNAPMIEECPVNIDCKVIKSFEINNMEVFVAEIVNTFVEEGCIGEWGVDIKKVDPLIYAFGGSYWSIGNMVDGAFKHKTYKK